MITVFDNMIVMKDKDGHAGVWDTIDKLGELLDMHGIKHAFAYPHPATIEANPQAVAVLNYLEDDEMAVSLIYALFNKMHRNSTDIKLAECLMKPLRTLNIQRT